MCAIDHSLIAEMAKNLRDDIDREILEELLDNPVFWGSDWTDLEEFLNKERDNG